MLTLGIFFGLLMQVWSLFGSQMLQTFCIEGLRISAQYRVQILQSRKDICWHLWSASFLQSVELVRFELSIDGPNTTW